MDEAFDRTGSERSVRAGAFAGGAVQVRRRMAKALSSGGLVAPLRIGDARYASGPCRKANPCCRGPPARSIHRLAERLTIWRALAVASQAAVCQASLDPWRGRRPSRRPGAFDHPPRSNCASSCFLRATIRKRDGKERRYFGGEAPGASPKPPPQPSAPAIPVGEDLKSPAFRIQGLSLSVCSEPSRFGWRLRNRRVDVVDRKEHLGAPMRPSGVQR